MKYFTRSKLYKASNVVFNPETIEATSYGWWLFVKKINGLVVFNNNKYSNSTIKHQANVRSLLSDLSIEIDLEVNCRVGLQDCKFLDDITNLIDYKISKLEDEINTPRSHKKKNIEREFDIKELKESRINILTKLS